MTNRQKLTLKLFQKNYLLKMTVPAYKRSVLELLMWFIKQDDAAKDQTTAILPKCTVNARIVSRDNIIVAGMEEIITFFGKNIIINNIIPDGKKARKNDVIAILSGESRIILSLERTILNVLQRMSGIATQTNFFTEKIKKPFIAATRKTPWMLLDKKAVAVGGGITHRLNLNDGVLIKDNHLEIIKKEYGLVNEEQAVEKILTVMQSQDDNRTIEIEVNTVNGAKSAIKTFSSLKTKNYLTIMFDNWEPESVKKFIKEEKIPTKISNQILFEASGNITGENVVEWGTTNVDFISMGSLTHSAKAADLSMEII